MEVPGKWVGISPRRRTLLGRRAEVRPLISSPRRGNDPGAGKDQCCSWSRLQAEKHLGGRLQGPLGWLQPRRVVCPEETGGQAPAFPEPAQGPSSHFRAARRRMTAATGLPRDREGQDGEEGRPRGCRVVGWPGAGAGLRSSDTPQTEAVLSDASGCAALAGRAPGGGAGPSGRAGPSGDLAPPPALARTPAPERSKSMGAGLVLACSQANSD